jgi:plastocyanin domain-containing protein
MKRVLMIGLIAMLASSSFALTRASAKPKTQRARVEIGERGFTPVSLKLRRGVRARLTFLRTTDATCAKEIVLPEFNIRRALPLNQPVVVTFTPTKRGPVTFACGMNMMRGQLIVQ